MESLEPRVRVGWLVGTLGTAVTVAGALLVASVFVVGFPNWFVGVVGAAVVVLGGIHVLFRYRAWRFDVREDALYIERGVLTKVTTLVPYVRVQHVDTRRQPLERLLGLSSVVVYTAGSRRADITIPGLTPERARRLRDQLRDLTVATEDDAV